MKKYFTKTNIALFLSLTAIIISIMSYMDSGFNDFLSREPVTVLPSELDPLQFDQLTQDISGNKITSLVNGNLIGTGINADNITTGEMEFDRARGGILELGGRNNTSGIFSLKDENADERISMDKDGMTINKGAMVIKDANNKTIIDAKGLVSTANF